MRLLKYLLEWKYQEGYAGRGIIRSVDEPYVMLWIFLQIPFELGLLWTLPDGTTYLNSKKVGKVKVSSSSSTSHKQVIGQLYSKLGYNKLPGDLRDNVEKYYEQNPRGRILKDEIFAYEFGSSDPLASRRHENRITQAISMIKRYISDKWWLKKSLK